MGKQSTRRVLARVACSPPCRRLACSAPAGSIRARERPAEQSPHEDRCGPGRRFGVLTVALDEPGADVLHSLHQLGVDAQAAVPSYLGLSVIVDGSDPPFTFTTVEDGAADDVRTSLRLTLPGVGAESVSVTAGHRRRLPSSSTRARRERLSTSPRTWRG